MSRYDVDKFVPLPDQELICCICTNVLDEPVESPCRHVFCKICIETWLNNKNNCPTCRNRVTKIELKPVLPLVRNMLNKLTLMCDFIDNGCKDLISLEKYPTHIETCDYESVVCQYPNCAKSMLRKIIRCHEEEECPCREILCSKECGLRIPFEEINTHDCLSALKAFGKARNKQTELLKAELTELRTKFEQLKQEVKTLKKEASRRRHSSWESSSTSSQNSDYSIVGLRSRSSHSRSRSPSRSLSHSLSRSPFRSLHTSDSSVDSFPLPNRERDEQEAILNSIGIITHEHTHGPPRPPTTFNANAENHSPIRNNAPTHGYRCIMCDEIYEYCTCVREPTTTRDTEEDSHHSVDSFGEGQFSPESDLSNSDVLNNSTRTLDNNAHSSSNRERSYTSTASSLPSRIEDESSQDGYSPTACSSQSRRNEDISGSRSENNNGYSPSARPSTPEPFSSLSRNISSSSRYLHLLGHSSSERVESIPAPNEKALINSPTEQIGLLSREHSSSIRSDYSPTCISKDQSSSTKYWSHWGNSPVAFVSRTPSPHTSHSSSPHSKFSTTYSPTGVSRNELHNVLSSSDCSRPSPRRTSRRLESSSEENSEIEHEVATPPSEHITDHSFNGEDDTGTSTPHSEYITDQSFNREYDTSDNQDHNSSHSHDSSGSDADAYEHSNRISGTESSTDNSCRSSDDHSLFSNTKKKVRCRKRKRSKQLCATESWSTTESESSCMEYETQKNMKRRKLTIKNDKYKTHRVSLAPTTRRKHGEDINTPSMSNQYVTRSSASNSNEISNTNETLLELSEELLSLREAPSPERPQPPRQITNPSNSDDNPSVR